MGVTSEGIAGNWKRIGLKGEFVADDVPEEWPGMASGGIDVFAGVPGAWIFDPEGDSTVGTGGIKVLDGIATFVRGDGGIETPTMVGGDNQKCGVP
jgi:hypothetical protein